MLTAGLVLGTVAFAYATQHKKECDFIDGKEQVVKTDGDTVADVLIAPRASTWVSTTPCRALAARPPSRRRLRIAVPYGRNSC